MSFADIIEDKIVEEAHDDILVDFEYTDDRQKELRLERIIAIMGCELFLDYLEVMTNAIVDEDEAWKLENEIMDDLYGAFDDIDSTDFLIAVQAAKKMPRG